MGKAKLTPQPTISDQATMGFCFVQIDAAISRNAFGCKSMRTVAHDSIADLLKHQTVTFSVENIYTAISDSVAGGGTRPLREVVYHSLSTLVGEKEILKLLIAVHTKMAATAPIEASF